MAKEGFYLVKSILRHCCGSGWHVLPLWEGYGISVSTRIAPVTDEVELTGTGWFPIALRTDIPRITTVNAQAAPPTNGVKSVCTLRVNFSTNTGEEKIKSGATVTDELALAARQFTLATDKAFSCSTPPRPQGYPTPRYGTWYC